MPRVIRQTALGPNSDGFDIPVFLQMLLIPRPAPCSPAGCPRASPWQFFLILLGVCFLLTAAANLAKFAVLVAIVLHAFFNSSSGLVKALIHDLPRVSDGELNTGGLCLWDSPWSHHSRHADQQAKICLTLT